MYRRRRWVQSMVPGGWDVQAVWRGWAAARRLDAARLERVFGLEPELYCGRPRLAFPTEVGATRYRYLDGNTPKAHWEAGAGGRAHWYGLHQAQPLIGVGPIWLVNGEPSVWACWQSGVPAACTAMGETTLPRDLAPLQALGVPVRIAFDLDTPGRRGARDAERLLRGAGVDAAAVLLPQWLGPGADVDDLHQATGNEGLHDALLRLPSLDWVRTRGSVDGQEPPSTRSHRRRRKRRPAKTA